MIHPHIRQVSYVLKEVSCVIDRDKCRPGISSFGILSETTKKYKIQEHYIVVDVILCLHISQSCQSPTSRHFKPSSIDIKENNEIDDEKMTDPTKIPNSACLQHYSNYSLNGYDPFLIPSGCKCHEVKYLGQY